MESAVMTAVMAPRRACTEAAQQATHRHTQRSSRSLHARCRHAAMRSHEIASSRACTVATKGDPISV
eukprot:scaffold29944_cov64-Phaeocystis_antarctica.AAC.3